MIKCDRLRVYVYIYSQLTALSNRRILYNFQIWIKSLRIISPKNPLEIEKNYLSPSKCQTFSQLFCVAHS